MQGNLWVMVLEDGAGNASISLNAAGIQPSGCQATVAASMPEHTLR
jgi:hypothetical protein